jgi:hypothetical protein
LCEGASIGRIYKEQLVDHQSPATKAVGPDVWFAGADSAKLAQLKLAMEKAINFHPTFSAARPCSEVWAIKGLQGPIESIDGSGKVIKKWTSGVEACEELKVKVADMWGHLHGFSDRCGKAMFQYSSVPKVLPLSASSPPSTSSRAGGPFVYVYSLGHNNHSDFMTCGVPSPPLGPKAGPFESYMLFCCCMKSLRQTIRKKYRVQLDVRAEGLVDLRHEDIWLMGVMGAKKAKKGAPKNVLHFARVVGAMSWDRAYAELQPAIDSQCLYTQETCSQEDTIRNSSQEDTIRNVFFCEPLHVQDGPTAPRGYRHRATGVGATMQPFAGSESHQGFAGAPRGVDGDAW